MKFAAVVLFLVVCLAVGVHSASKQLTLNGKAHIQFFGPKDEIWNGLSHGNRYPIINSGDIIALRSAYNSGSYVKYWLYCHTSYCLFTSGPSKVMTTSKWSSLNGYAKFMITARGKMDGQPINSGDTVILSSPKLGSKYWLRCWTSTSYQCRLSSFRSKILSSDWLTYSYATFQIYSRYAPEGTPIQYRDIVAFKYPFAGYSTWLYYSSGRFYTKSCSYYNKASCATENTTTGLRIFKKL
ncbi:unnamed protein product [Porites evermanni]|uniref:Uncharacterized protein n=1 Tax=Porites evermanni TaxID=104178 RepID=A0ABN8LML8_9CNID|nr:unnamed protein product [Porites evermanni]